MFLILLIRKHRHIMLNYPPKATHPVSDEATFETRASDFIDYVLNQITTKSQVNKEVKVEIHITGPHGFLPYSQDDPDYNNGVFFKMGSLDCVSITWGRH